MVSVVLTVLLTGGSLAPGQGTTATEDFPTYNPTTATEDYRPCGDQGISRYYGGYGGFGGYGRFGGFGGFGSFGGYGGYGGYAGYAAFADSPGGGGCPNTAGAFGSWPLVYGVYPYPATSCNFSPPSCPQAAIHYDACPTAAAPPQTCKTVPAQTCSNMKELVENLQKVDDRLGNIEKKIDKLEPQVKELVARQKAFQEMVKAKEEEYRRHMELKMLEDRFRQGFDRLEDQLKQGLERMDKRLQKLEEKSTRRENFTLPPYEKGGQGEGQDEALPKIPAFDNVAGNFPSKNGWTAVSRTSTRYPTKALLIVSLPAEARVFLEGKPTKTSNKTLRTYLTPELEVGAKYSFLVRVELVREGKTIQETRQVPLQAGQEIRLSFDHLKESEKNTRIVSK